MSQPVYSKEYYRRLRSDSERSAARVVPLILEWFHPGSVVDVGCGHGAWARAYAEAGLEKVLGIDGPCIPEEQLLIRPGQFRRQDLSEPFKLEERFDLVNCLEVAEHLPPERASGFVSDLCRLGEVVVFSAAVPGQGGTHHLNEQWPAYWIERFRQNNFEVLDCFRPRLWNDSEVAWWYAQNMLAFIPIPRLPEFPAAVQAAQASWPANLVHPRAYEKAALPKEMSPRMIKEVFRALPHFPNKIWKHFRS